MEPQGAAGGAAASSAGFRLQEEREAEGAERSPRGAESLRGAEAMLDVPPKGNNVSSVYYYSKFNVRAYYYSSVYINFHR